MSLNPVIEKLGRPIRLALIGGGPGSFIGRMHRSAARLDGRYDMVAAVLSSNPEKSRSAGLEIGIPADRAYSDVNDMLSAEAARKFGIERPKAAILAATEKVSPAMPATLDAAILAQMARRGQIRGVDVDGPLALDVALSEEAAAVKGVESPVAGNADILIFPDIEAGNIFYKAVTKLAGGRLGAVVAGAAAPCVLTSRADDEETKFLSIVLGCLLG